LVALGVGLVVAFGVTRVGWVVLAIVLGVFVVAVILGLLFEETSKGRDPGRGLPGRLGAVLRRDQPFWAGQLSHVGVVLVAIGIAFAANLGDHVEVDMAPGDTVSFAGFAITYVSPFQQDSPGKVTRGARLEVIDGRGRSIVMEPAANYFGADTTGVSTPAVRTMFRGDLYVTLLALDPERATMTFDTSPMIWLIWVGGGVIAAGGFWSVAARRGERARAPARQTADV
jgi:cytochrome c-type biogenesis protein CcmF